jgi:alpha-tubulin suppressor-like RCC1 family protein/tRNA A-37 threonylcarbamoyl transferase component Bud32
MAFRETDLTAGYAELEAEYESLGELGRGGTSVVYLARDRVLGREVAIKVIRARFLDDEEALARFAREARTAALLQHPNIVSVHSVKRLSDGGLALVMQYVPGRTLKQAILQEAPFAFDRAETVLRDVGEALAFAHARGVVHRDVKPENIFLDEVSGRTLLADFGIAHNADVDTHLTLAGTAIGTPAYMSPEQIDGIAIDGRSDLFSLALVGWEMLSGQAPWEGEGLYSVIYKQKNEALPSLAELRPGTPPRLWLAIDRALQKEPDARPDSVAGFLAEVADASPRARWRRWRAALWIRPWLPRGLPAYGGAETAMDGAQGVPTGAETVRYQRAEEVPLEPAPDAAPAASSDPWARQRRAAGVAFLLLAATAAVVSALYLRPSGNDAAPPTTVQTEPAARSVTPPLAAAASAEIAEAAQEDSGAVSALSDTAFAAPPSADSVPTSPAPAVAPPAAAAASAAAPSASAPAEPSAPAGGTEARLVVTGGMHSCVLGVQGEVRCWGGNDRGQLGSGGTGRRSVPGDVSGRIRFASLSLGISHSCGITGSGEVFCWGSNSSGQLGNGAFATRTTPTRVTSVPRLRDMGLGMSHSCGLSRAGEVFCWGDNLHGQLGSKGAVATFTPLRVDGSGYAGLAVGWNHSCALTRGGTAVCWGQNTFGQLGDGSTTDRTAPTAVEGGMRFSALAAGSAHSCALAPGGAAFCWGRNTHGQVGDGSTADRTGPARVRAPGGFASITAGSVHSCALTRGGAAFCWGRNNYGQLGDGSTTDRGVPVQVAGGHAFASIRANGAAHTCGTTRAGETLCWGYNVEGQLGDGTRSNRTTPVRVAASRS